MGGISVESEAVILQVHLYIVERNSQLNPVTREDSDCISRSPGIMQNLNNAIKKFNMKKS